MIGEITLWERLGLSLAARYPDDWQDRLRAHRDGSDPDLQKWRQIGGEALILNTASAPFKNATFIKASKAGQLKRMGYPVPSIARRLRVSVKRAYALLAIQTPDAQVSQ